MTTRRKAFPHALRGLRELGAGRYTSAYGKPGNLEVYLVSTCAAKVCQSFGWLPGGSLLGLSYNPYPELERLDTAHLNGFDYTLYKTEASPPLRTPKQLNPTSQSLLRDFTRLASCNAVGYKKLFQANSRMHDLRMYETAGFEDFLEASIVNLGNFNRSMFLDPTSANLRVRGDNLILSDIWAFAVGGEAS